MPIENIFITEEKKYKKKKYENVYKLWFSPAWRRKFS